jgi:hypothetical protein
MVAEVATAERQTCGSHRLTHAFNAFLYDGAPDADHHRRLLDLGIPLANTTASKVAHLDPKSRNETRIEHIHDLGNWPHTHNPEDGSPSCTSRLVAIGGQVHLQETVNGEVEYTALEHKFKPVWRSGRRYLYIELNVPCRRRRTTGSIRMSLQRSTYAKNDASGNDRLHVYAAITRGIRVWPVGTEAGKKLKGDRVAIEAKHSVWDDAWPNRRIPAWSNHMRRVLLLGWAYGDNILTEARLARARAASEALERAG